MAVRRRRCPPGSRAARSTAWLLLAWTAFLASATGASAAIDFRADWEDARTGQAPPAPWEGFEYGGTFDGTPAPGEQLAVVESPVRSGRLAARFTVRPGDRYGGSTGERALVRWLGSNERDGDDRVYGWSTLFPRDWQQPPGWGLITEWHADARFPLAPIRLNAGGDSLTLSLSAGECPTPYGCAIQRNLPLLSSLARGRWNDLVVRIAWRTGPTGRIQVWHRLEGEAAFRAVLDVRDVPTLPWRAGEQPSAIYLLHGLYRDAGTGASTVYHDGFVRGDSVAEVMAAFPSAPAREPVDRVVDPTCDTCSVDVARLLDGLHVLARTEGTRDDVDTAYAVVPAPVGREGGLVVGAVASLLVDGAAVGPTTFLALLDAAGRSVAEVGVDRLGFLELVSRPQEPAGRARRVRTGAMLGPSGRQRQLELVLGSQGELALVVDGTVRGGLGPDPSLAPSSVAGVAAGLLRQDGADAAGAPAASLARLRIEPARAEPVVAGPDELPDPFEPQGSSAACAGCSVAVDGSALVVRASLGSGPAYAVARDAAREWAWPLAIRADLRVSAPVGVAAMSLLAVLDGDGREIAELLVSPAGRVGLRSPAGGLATASILAWTGARVALDGSRATSIELELAPDGWASLQLDGRESLALDGLTGGTRARPVSLRAGLLGGRVADGAVATWIDRLVVAAAA